MRMGIELTVEQDLLVLLTKKLYCKFVPGHYAFS